MAELRDMKALVEPGRALTEDEILRYSRHLLLPNIDLLGQQRLLNAKVLCVGAGGLGSPTIMYLAAAGVGTIGVMDFDNVELSNLQRQIIHAQSDLGKSKALSASQKVHAQNPETNIILHELKLDETNALEIFKDYDLIIDCTDNFATRYLINDAAALLSKPYIWGSIYQFDGQASIFWSLNGPCLRCLHPTPPPVGSVPSCAEGGVFGVLCGAIGSIQTIEALKLITGIGKPLLGEVLIYNALEQSYQKLPIQKSSKCPICSGEQTSLLPNYEEFCSGLTSISPSQLQDKLASTENIYLVDVREPDEYALANIANAILLPVGKFDDGSALTELPNDREIILYCRSGKRSARALSVLRASGFSNSTHLAGGILAWQESTHE